MFLQQSFIVIVLLNNFVYTQNLLNTFYKYNNNPLPPSNYDFLQQNFPSQSWFGEQRISWPTNSAINPIPFQQPSLIIIKPIIIEETTSNYGNNDECTNKELNTKNKQQKTKKLLAYARRAQTLNDYPSANGFDEDEEMINSPHTKEPQRSNTIKYLNPFFATAIIQPNHSNVPVDVQLPPVRNKNGMITKVRAQVSFVPQYYPDELMGRTRRTLRSVNNLSEQIINPDNQAIDLMEMTRLKRQHINPDNEAVDVLQKIQKPQDDYIKMNVRQYLTWLDLH